MSADNLKLTSTVLDQPILPLSAADVRSAAVTVAEWGLSGACGSHLGAPDGAQGYPSATDDLRGRQILDVLDMLGITADTLSRGMFSEYGEAVA